MRNFAMHLHPYVVAYIKKAPLLGSSLFTKWKKKYSKNIKLIEDQDVALLDYKIYDKDRNLVELEKWQSATDSSYTINKQSPYESVHTLVGTLFLRHLVPSQFETVAIVSICITQNIALYLW